MAELTPADAEIPEPEQRVRQRVEECITYGTSVTDADTVDLVDVLNELQAVREALAALERAYTFQKEGWDTSTKCWARVAAHPVIQPLNTGSLTEQTLAQLDKLVAISPVVRNLHIALHNDGSSYEQELVDELFDLAVIPD